MKFSKSELDIIYQYAATKARFLAERDNSIRQRLAAAKMQKPIMHGHDLSGEERFLPQTQHMITLEVQKDCFVGFKGERFRFYLSDEGYRNAKHSEQEGEIIHHLGSGTLRPAGSVLRTADDFRSAPIITGDKVSFADLPLPLRWLCQLPLCGLVGRNHLALQAGSVRQVLRNPAILFQWESV